MAGPKILVLDRNEELAERLRSVVTDLTLEAEVISCTRVGSAGHVQEHDGPFSILVAGPSLSTRTGLRRLASLHKDNPLTSIVIAFSNRPEASLKEIVQVGADDLVELPADDTALRGMVVRSLDLWNRRNNLVPAIVQAQPAAAGSPARGLGRVFTISSASGGCGKTFFATNMAYFLSRFGGAKVALVDLDLQFGEVTTALRLQPGYTIVDVLSRDGEPGADLAEHIEEYVSRFDDTFHVLPTPRDPAEADRITPVEVTRVIGALQQRYDYVVVDTPAALAETVLAAFDVSEHLFVMATLDLPSVRNCSVFLQTLDKLRIPADNISLVLNKVEQDVGIEVSQLTKLFPQGFLATLPYAREVSKSINFGKPVLASHPEVEISRKLGTGLRKLLPEHVRSQGLTVPAAAKPRLFGRLLKRVSRDSVTLPAGGATHEAL